MKPYLKNRAIDDAKLKSILQAERAAALGTTMSSDLSEQRMLTLDYYMGQMDDMTASEGESSAISSDVQDVVEGTLPIVLDALTSGDRVAEFKPHGAGDEKSALQETDYVNHVFFQENDGYLILYTAVKDALLSKNGFIKWGREKEEERVREHYKGLTADAFALLSADKDIRIVDNEEYEAADPETQQPAKFYNATAETRTDRWRNRVWAVPPEEIIMSKSGRQDIQSLPYWAHVLPKSQADLIARFPDMEADIRSAPAAVASADNGEAINRQTVQDSGDNLLSTNDINKDMRQIEVAEHYIRLGLEEDEVVRRYKITTISPTVKILDIEEVTSWPLATGTPIIMPHRIIGRAVADLAVDIQQTQTSLLRATLNNAYYANNQRTEVPESHASENTIDDLLNNRVGGIVRTKIPGGLKQLETQPIGHWTLPLIEHMNGVRENRTGITRYNQGLDADSLNATATGVTRIMDAAEMRMKLVTRTLAETLIVNTMRGLHQMLQEFDEEEHSFQANGEWVTVNPREWKRREHMKVTMPISGASKQQLIGFHMQMLGVQKEAMMQQGGPDGPLVSWQNVYNNLDRTIRLAGITGIEPFFMKPAPPNPSAPKPPDPDMVKAQGQMQIAAAKQQSDAAISQQKQQGAQNISQQKLEHSAEMAQLKQHLDHQREQDKFAHQQKLDQMQFQHESALEAMKAGLEMRLEAFKAQEAAKLNAQQAELSAKKDVGNV